MKVIFAVAVALPMIHAESSNGFTACSSNMVEFKNPIGDTSDCEDFTVFQNASYPKDFNVLNAVAHFECPTSNVRIIVSNGIPNHDVIMENPNEPCRVDWFVKLPLNPTYSSTISEPSDSGIIAMALNGVPGFGAQEDGSYNAMSDSASNPASDAKNWWGHADTDNQQHYHNPTLGHEEELTSSDLKGYALDGFPIYGPLDDDSVLDSCNGIFNSDGSYQYHTRTVDQVDENSSYCNGSNPWVNWNYILGCFHGDMSTTVVGTSTSETIPSDCQLVDSLSNNVDQLSLTYASATSSPTSSPTSSSSSKKRKTSRGLRARLN